MNVSACSAGLSYVHDSIAPAVPAFTGTSPTSPSNSSTTSVLGTTEASATVRLFTSSTCSGAAAATGIATSSGTFSVGVTVAANSTTATPSSRVGFPLLD